MAPLHRHVAAETAANRILDRLWTQPGTSYAAFAGKHLLRQAITGPNKRNKTQLGPNDIQRYLTEQAAYTRHAPALRRYPKPFYNMVKLYHLVEADLIETGRVQQFNNGVRYLLLAIECTSRKIFVVPMKDKTGESSTAAFRRLLDKEFAATPHTLRTDRGSEWKDRRFQALLRQKGIRHLYANNTEKASMCERAIQTLQRRIHRYLTHNGTFRFLPVLSKIVESINNTPHASTGIAPNLFSDGDVYTAWEKYYLEHRQAPRPFRYNIGDTVRVNLDRRQGMDKAYRGTFSPAIYTVRARRNTRPHAYVLYDAANEPVEGAFFEQELMPARDRKDQKYMIGRVVERRVNPTTKKKEMQVTWDGWPDSVRTWQPNATVTTTAAASTETPQHGRRRI